MEEIQSIQWFPGHMTKTKRKMAESIKLVDVVAEIVDARIPQSSRNPDFDDLLKTKPRVIILNKCDIADEMETKKWGNYYSEQGIKVILADCKSGKGVNTFIPTVRELLKDKIELYKEKKMVGRSLKIMVVGIPNVGKSSFINRISKGRKAKVEDRPGVTRGNQWFTIDKNFELLDTPGVLWPKFEDKKVGEKLAFTGAIKDGVMDMEQLSVRLVEFLAKDYSEQLKKRYKLNDEEIAQKDGRGLLGEIGKKRGMLISGGEIDIERASVMILDEFRAAKVGKVTLDKLK